MASPSTAPKARPTRARKPAVVVRPALGEDEIVTAALEIIAESGVEGLTMRRLSAKLGVALGATYHHMPNKHALLVLTANQVYSRIAIPERDAEHPLAQVREVLINVTEVLRPYPGLALYMMQHPAEIPMVDVIDAVQGAISHAGLHGAAKERVLNALFFLLAGTIVSGLTTTARPDTMTPEMVDASFAASLDVVLAGAEVEVERERANPRPRRARR